MVKTMNCVIVSSNSSRAIMFTFGQIPLEKVMKPLILLAMDYIVPLLFFSKDGFGIKWYAKVYMPLNKETKPSNSLKARKRVDTT